MKLLKASLTNFQSYQSLEFDYSELGLTLVSGKTKSGKSTVLDAPLWILYGETSKESNVDDVRSWFSDKELTTGTISVDISGKVFSVTRKRGSSSLTNDLYIEQDGDIIRGKDLLDTQKIINEKLGVSSDIFILGSYLHQFTDAGSFFISKPKERRELLEYITDLTFPSSIEKVSSEHKKKLKKQILNINGEIQKISGKLEAEKQNLSALLKSQQTFNENKQSKLIELTQKNNTFILSRDAEILTLAEEAEKLDSSIVNPKELDIRIEQIDAQLMSIESIKQEYADITSRKIELETNIDQLTREIRKLESFQSDQCPTCLGEFNNPNLRSHKQELIDMLQDLSSQLPPIASEWNRLHVAISYEPKLLKSKEKLIIEVSNNDKRIHRFETLVLNIASMKTKTSPYSNEISSLEKEINPFDTLVDSSTLTIGSLEESIKIQNSNLGILEKEMVATDWLYDKSFDLRGVLIQRIIGSITKNTNDTLERFFGADIKIDLRLKGVDTLDVSIFNLGYSCPFRQLSGGERCLLKLAFSTALMREIENNKRVVFSTLMLDEALNGLDSELKINAFSFLQYLLGFYETILVVDHSEEIKQLFTKKFMAIKNGNVSQLYEDS